MRFSRRTPIVVCLALLITVCVAAAVDIDASLNRDTIRVGEIAELTIAVSGTVTGVGRPELPAVDYISVVSSSSQKSIELIDGQMRSTTTYTFGIRASREGTYEIPPVEVPVDDRVLTTRALTLSVISDGRPGPQPDPPTPPELDPLEPAPEPVSQRPDIDATTEVDNRRPWVGEQVTLTLSFTQSHRAGLVGNAHYQPPSAQGLVVESLPDDDQRTVWLDGTPYEVSTRNTALFALTPGEYTIGPAEITYRRSYVRAEERITTDPITLSVRALPRQGRPEDFSGVVGQLQTRMSTPSGQVRVGEALSLRLEVSGTGDLRQLEAPEVTVDGEARVDPGGVEREISPQRVRGGYLIGGRVVFDYLLVPREAGKLMVNPVRVHYFNPETGRYELAQTSPIEIAVEPGDLGQIAGTTAEGPELRYIKEGSRGLKARQPVTASGWFWGAQVLPLLALGWAIRRRAEMRRRENDPGYRRRVEAAENARAVLRLAARSDEPVEVFRRSDEAMAGYIAAKTGAAEAGISPASARELLVEAGVSDEHAQRAAELLKRLRAGAYAPGTAEDGITGEIVDRVGELVAELEAVLPS